MSDRFETQDRLIAATRTVMISHGIEGCTLERICAEAGFSRGAFYSNFGGKEDLFTLVARDEYDTTIRRLNRVATKWETGLREEYAGDLEEAGENYLEIMNDLLGKVLAEIKLDRDYFIVHNELLVRAAREPAWAVQFRDINREFVLSMSRVLNQILTVVGRRMTRRPEAIAQAVIGIVLRATGYDSWKHELTAADTKYHARGTLLDTNDINDMIVMLLSACSEPLSTTPDTSD